MLRSVEQQAVSDLHKKMVVLTGPRQVGKTTLARNLMAAERGRSQYLNWDVAADREVLRRQSWSPAAKLLVLDEIHKMPEWKRWLKGVADARPRGQRVLVTGSARMETFRQSGESLAGRYVALRLHPISVREWCGAMGGTPADALERLIERGGFPEPCLAEDPIEADRWRRQYFTDLIREDVVELGRVHEVAAMRTFAELLRERVGSPLSLASIARDLSVSPTTIARYLEVLKALYIVFTVHPWHHNIARAISKSPKVYFFDTGLVRGDEGVRFENAVAAMLLRHVHHEEDVRGRDAGLHYIRTKDDAEVDFALSDGGRLTHLVECKESDTRPHRALRRFAEEHPRAQAMQLVRHARQEESRPPIRIVEAASWLAGLAS
jgi:predicted AAA+ superfamily ATPase